MALMSATSCASRLTLRPFAPGRSAGSIQGVDDHAEDREPSPFDVGRLGANKTRYGLDGGLVGLGLLEHRKDARFYEFRNLHRVARCDGKGMLHACNQCSHFVFSFSPLTAGDAACIIATQRSRNILERSPAKVALGIQRLERTKTKRRRAGINEVPVPFPHGLCADECGSLQLALALMGGFRRVISYPEFFKLPEPTRTEIRWKLNHIAPALRWRSSSFVNYEALQAPLAYAVLAFPERVLARAPLPSRVLVLRIIAGAVGALVLLFGALCLGRQLRIAYPYNDIAVFCALSSQMIWATLAHVANDWLAVPVTALLLVTILHYLELPVVRRAILLSVVLTAGLLTKAYFIAFIPIVILVCAIRHRWRDMTVVFVITTILAGPWYVRNVTRYGTVSGMQELREGTDPISAVASIRPEKLLAGIEASARAALWTGNNTFRSFAISVLRALMASWLAGFLLWAGQRHRPAEWLVLSFFAIFILALAYDTAVSYVFTHGEGRSGRLRPRVFQVRGTPAFG